MAGNWWSYRQQDSQLIIFMSGQHELAAQAELQTHTHQAGYTVGHLSEIKLGELPDPVLKSHHISGSIIMLDAFRG